MEITKPLKIESRILTFRQVQALIDRDLADLYQVDPKMLNQAVKRNIERFPEAIKFQFSSTEKNELVKNCDRFKNLTPIKNKTRKFELLQGRPGIRCNKSK